MAGAIQRGPSKFTGSRFEAVSETFVSLGLRRFEIGICPPLAPPPFAGRGCTVYG